jgi:cation diffusion facilitator CzcD-associated flavoprotein CzcO
VWTVQTKQGGALHADYLIVASGVQNDPWIPDVERSASEIKETHSYDLHRPESLSGQRVTVIGGGASSQDLLDLAIENGAKDIHWVYRKVKWFLPTRRDKQRAWPNLRELGLGQSVHGTRTASALMRWLLRFRYDRFGISELAPAVRLRQAPADPGAGKSAPESGGDLPTPGRGPAYARTRAHPHER